MTKDEIYNPAFFDQQTNGSLRSARVIAPLVFNLIQPDSVVDVGCGRGVWLAVFRDLGAERILGVDGPWAQNAGLVIPESHFIPTDLTKPFTLGETFELAVSLEVAEHLPPSSARDFVKSLTLLAPVVLFSAAVPGQPGTSHINCRWPDYWANEFARLGFRMLDPIRKEIWKNVDVEWWYRQNTFLFVHEQRLPDYARLGEIARQPNDMALVHRGVLDGLVKSASIRWQFRSTLGKVRGAFRRRLGRAAL